MYQTRGELMRMLADHPRVPLETWGENGTKTFRELFDELTHHESVIEDRGTKLARVLTTILLRVVYRDPSSLKRYVLVRRVRRIGSTRPVKSTPASIKKKAYRAEYPRRAAARILRSELGVPQGVATTTRLVEVSDKEAKPSPSTSYPGLYTERRTVIFSFTMPHECFEKKYVVREKGKVVTYRWVLWKDRPWAK